MTRFRLIAALALYVAGCGTHETPHAPALSPPVQTARKTDLSEQQVLDIARKAVQANDTWADRGRFEVKKNADGTWSVMVWRIEGYDMDGKPQFVPGGYRFITIDQQGKVTDYMRGA